MFGFLSKYFSNDLAIDLGTANTLIYVRGRGMVVTVGRLRTCPDPAAPHVDPTTG